MISRHKSGFHGVGNAANLRGITNFDDFIKATDISSARV